MKWVMKCENPPSGCANLFRGEFLSLLLLRGAGSWLLLGVAVWNGYQHDGSVQTSVDAVDTTYEQINLTWGIRSNTRCTGNLGD